MVKFNIFVVHYSKLVERKQNIKKIFDTNNLDIEFIESFNQEELNNDILNEYYNQDRNDYLKRSVLWGKNAIEFYELNKAEISCTLKHIEAIKKASLSPVKYSLILEDDSIPYNKTFYSEIEDIIKRNKDWDVLFIGNGLGDNYIKSKLNFAQKFSQKFFRSKFFNVKHPASNCAEAYIIDKDAAKKIYNSIVPFSMVSDWELAYQFYLNDLNINWFLPSIFYQGSRSGDYKSTLR